MKEANHILQRSNGRIQNQQAMPVSFNVAEMRSKLLVSPDDILLAETDEIDSRNKRVYIKDEERSYTLMNVSFARLHNYAPYTFMVNKNTMIAADIIHGFQYDIITLKNLFTGWDGKQVILSKKYKAGFYGLNAFGGGVGMAGTLFSFDPNGNVYTVLGTFSGTKGWEPGGNVTLANGIMYGMTPGSGTHGNIFTYTGCNLGVTIGGISPFCFGEQGGLLSNPVYGTPPYTYSWSPGGNTNASEFAYAGNYTLTVTDNNGCTATSSIVLSQPAPLSANAHWYCYPFQSSNGDAYSLPSGGTSPYAYSWSNGGTGYSIIGVTSGFYTVTVGDANGCTATDVAAPCALPDHHATRHGQQDDSITLIAAAISSYPNPTNGQFTTIGLDKGMSIEIYDYMGSLVSKIVASSETMQFNLSGQSNGIYLVRILSSDGTLVKETKVLKVE